jgi:hypothetical protein
MAELDAEQDRRAIARAIALVGSALHECDEHGFIYAAIGLSSALDKLEILEMQAAAGDA